MRLRDGNAGHGQSQVDARDKPTIPSTEGTVPAAWALGPCAFNPQSPLLQVEARCATRRTVDAAQEVAKSLKLWD